MTERTFGRRKFLEKLGAASALTAIAFLTESIDAIRESESESELPGNNLHTLYHKLFLRTETFKVEDNKHAAHLTSSFENARRKYSMHEVYQLEKNQIEKTTAYLTISYEGSESTYLVEKYRILKLEPGNRQRLNASEIEKVTSQMRTDYQEWYTNWPKPWEAPKPTTP